MTNDEKQVTAFYKNFKYEGILLETTELTYKIHDTLKDLTVILPISNTVLIYKEDKE